MSEENDIEQLMKDVEIRSEEVQEIMGFIPHWIIRGGITAIFFIVVLVLVGSYFFKYPDVIASTITLTTENPPAPILARTNGKIDEMFIKDKQKVQAGDFIAIIENATNYRHLFQLKKILAAHSEFFFHFTPPVPPSSLLDKNFSLGTLQSPYGIFLKSFADYRHFVTLDYHQKKINAINLQIARRKIMMEQSKRQAALIGEELKLSKKQYKRSEELHKDGVISQDEIDRSKTQYLQKEFSHESAVSSLASSKLQLLQLEQSVIDLQLQYRGEKKSVELTLNQAYENLSGSISQWEQQYLLKAPVSGVVTFNNFWSNNQNVKAGERVVTIIPEKGGKIIGRVVLPIMGSGKVKKGQGVNIKLMNFPYMDFGIVRGIVVSKSLVASDNFYAVEVNLPQGLITSYQKELEFNQEMQGTAEIITEEIRLLTRILKPIKAMFDKM